MKKQATIISHPGGFFLAINGDLNKREVVLNGLVKGMSHVQQYWKAIRKTNGTGYTSYDYDPQAIQTDIDLTNNFDLSIKDLWNPSLNEVDKETGHVNETPENKREFIKEVEPVFITDEQCEEQHKNNVEYNKSLKGIMENKVNRSQASKKGWETRRANIEAQIAEDAKAKIELANSVLAQKEEEAYDKLWAEAIEANERYDQALNDQKILEAEQAIQFAKDNPALNNQVNNNSKNMNKQEEATAVAPKRTLARRTRRNLAKVTEVGVVVTTDLLAGALVLGSDLLYFSAEAVAWTQASAVKPLGLHPDATRAELKDACLSRAENRSAAVTAIPKMVVALPKRGIATVKQAMAMRNNKNIVDIQNAEVVS